ncbi:MAG: cysteine--tRNA ligase [Patescibacteria group bacterium]|nr:MAG: cysteine--tRNA ligase [Patescibacteria group bacterium]
MDLYLYNTLSRQKEKFSPLNDSLVGLYTCGPTVYHYAHLGNLRTYLFEDILKRVLLYNDYHLRHVMNITDVGHLTGDRDMGEDKMEKGASREGKSAWEVADFFLKAFQEDLVSLNILDPDIWCKATDYIQAQIHLIQTLEAKDYVYLTSDGVYFDSAKFPDYNKLSHLKLDELKEGARVEKNSEKKNPTDFALWKFSPSGAKRQMEWSSPWGIGFPGWHIECSAMALHFLKGHLDIHCGAVDHINVHHTNEIAQSEAATGEKFFNFWLHGAFLNVGDDQKMSKSADNFLTLTKTLEETGLDPLAVRFWSFLTHYRKPMTYKAEAIKQAGAALSALRRAMLGWPEPSTLDKALLDDFHTAINDDLNMPQAVAVLQATVKAELDPAVKAATVQEMDKIFGLNFNFTLQEDIPSEIRQLAARREEARNEEDWSLADDLRTELTRRGWTIEDSSEGSRLRRV